MRRIDRHPREAPPRPSSGRRAAAARRLLVVLTIAGRLGCGLVPLVAGAAEGTVDAAMAACRVAVYANDPDPDGLNLRAGPAATHRIVARLTDGDARFDVVGAAGPWLRVARVRGVDGSMQFAGDAWVFGPLTAVRAIRRTALRVAPVVDATASGTMPADAVGAVEGCADGWVLVRHAKVRGWIAPGGHCGNPVSGCV